MRTEKKPYGSGKCLSISWWGVPLTAMTASIHTFSSNSKLAHSIHGCTIFCFLSFISPLVWAFTEKRSNVWESSWNSTLHYHHASLFIPDPGRDISSFVTFYSWNFIIIISFVNASSHLNDTKLMWVGLFGFFLRYHSDVPSCSVYCAAAPSRTYDGQKRMFRSARGTKAQTGGSINVRIMSVGRFMRLRTNCKRDTNWTANPNRLFNSWVHSIHTGNTDFLCTSTRMHLISF